MKHAIVKTKGQEKRHVEPISREKKQHDSKEKKQEGIDHKEKGTMKATFRRLQGKGGVPGRDDREKTKFNVGVKKKKGYLKTPRMTSCR